MTWRLLYKDNNDVNQVLGVLQGTVPSGAYSIQRARLKNRNRATDKLSVVAEADMYGNLPVALTDFTSSGSDPDADEPVVYWQTQQSTGLSIVGVDTGNDTFTVSGDVTDEFTEGGAIDVTGSTGNDGTYKVASQSDVSYSGGNDETTITVVEDVTDATADGTIDIYENIFRGFIQNQGVINEEGVHKFLIYDFSRYTGRQTVTVASVSTDINDAMDAVIPSGYTLDTPADANVTYIDSSGTEQTGPAPVDGYTLDDQRKVGYRELTHRYGYTLKFKADRTVRYEPIGFGSSIDTIDSRAEGDTNNTRGAFKEWTSDRTDKIINTIRVLNEADGNTYDSGTITNTSSVNTYGTLTPPHGLHLKVGYVQSTAEAQRVAHNIVKDEANPGEGGVVTVAGRYTQNVSNSSFTLNDSTRGVSGVFVCWEQTNFYPENRSELLFQFESDQDREAGVRDDIRAERAQTFADSSTDVGNQSVTTGDAESNTAATGGVGDAGDRSDDFSNVAKIGNVSSASGISNLRTVHTASASQDASNGATLFILAPNQAGTADTYYVNGQVTLTGVSTSGTVDMSITNFSASGDPTLISGSQAVVSEGLAIGVAQIALPTSESSVNVGEGDLLQLQVVNNTTDGSFDQMSITVSGERTHTHGDSIDTDNQAMGLTDDIGTSDGFHGGGSGNDQHGGSTATKNINVTSENKEDR